MLNYLKYHLLVLVSRRIFVFGRNKKSCSFEHCKNLHGSVHCILLIWSLVKLSNHIYGPFFSVKMGSCILLGWNIFQRSTGAWFCQSSCVIIRQDLLQEQEQKCFNLSVLGTIRAQFAHCAPLFVEQEVRFCSKILLVSPGIWVSLISTLYTGSPERASSCLDFRFSKPLKMLSDIT